MVMIRAVQRSVVRMLAVVMASSNEIMLACELYSKNVICVIVIIHKKHSLSF